MSPAQRPGALPWPLASAPASVSQHPDVVLIALCEEHIANFHAFNACALDDVTSPYWPAYQRTYAAVTAATPSTFAGALALAQVSLLEDGDEFRTPGAPGHNLWKALAGVVRLAGGAP